MGKKRILFVGCSFTADSGFTNENASKYHWPSLLSNHFDCYYYNAGMGGSSNEEIFYRTIEITTAQSYDLVIIMWSSLGRKWVYFSEPNIDDFTILTFEPKGLLSDSATVDKFSKLYLTYFNNQYVSLKHWLDQIICLQEYFKQKKQRYVFVKGFDNMVCEFDNIKYNHGFENVSNQIKKIINFNNNPDYYLLEKVQQIQKLIHQVDITNWIDFKNFNFYESAVDLADDDDHPGPKTNHAVSFKLIKHIEDNKLLG